MPLELIADQPDHAAICAYDEPPLQPDQVRIATDFSAVKHGTEMRIFRATSADSTDRWDPDMRLHRRGEAAQDQFPRALGEMFVGRVSEIGSAVTRFKTGDRVFGEAAVRQTHTVDEQSVRAAPDDVSAQAIVYMEAATFALAGVRDGHVRVGDRVAVFGLGALGQMSVQVALLAGARWVAAIDPIACRREAARRHGAHAVYDPAACDVGLEVKTQTGKLGVDVSIETSGAHAALNDALRATRYQGTVVSTAYYVGPASDLILSGEWHRNNLQIVSSRAVFPPPREFSWDDRLQPEALQLLFDGILKTDGLVDPIVPFDGVADAYNRINKNPTSSIKLGVSHAPQSP